MTGPGKSNDDTGPHVRAGAPYCILLPLYECRHESDFRSSCSGTFVLFVGLGGTPNQKPPGTTT